MRNALCTVLFFTTLAACGGNEAARPNDPSTVTPSSAPTEPAASPVATPADGAKPSGPASPAEGKCKSGEMPASAKDYDSCLNGCKGLDDSVPPGSKCISAKTSCVSQCSTKYKK